MTWAALPILLVLFGFWLSFMFLTHDLYDEEEDE